MKNNNRQNIQPSTQNPVIIHGYEGLTTDGVSARIVAMEPKAPKSKTELLMSLTVSDKVCVAFLQSVGYVMRTVEEIERRTNRRFYVEGRPGQTCVWRVA